jgi:hypothetical protein
MSTEKTKNLGTVAMDTNTDANASNPNVLRLRPDLAAGTQRSSSKSAQGAASKRTRKPLPNVDDELIVAELKKLIIDEKRKRLSGAAKHRYRFHRSQGKNMYEAYELAQRVMQDTLTPRQQESRDKRARDQSREGIRTQSSSNGFIPPTLPIGMGSRG